MPAVAAARLYSGQLKNRPGIHESAGRRVDVWGLYVGLPLLRPTSFVAAGLRRGLLGSSGHPSLSCHRDRCVGSLDRGGAGLAASACRLGYHPHQLSARRIRPAPMGNAGEILVALQAYRGRLAARTLRPSPGPPGPNGPICSPRDVGPVFASCIGGRIGPRSRCPAAARYAVLEFRSLYLL